MSYPSSSNSDTEPLLPTQSFVPSSAGLSFNPPFRSEVSKGKQRARPTPSEESGSGKTSAETTKPSSTGIIRIRFTEIADEANQGVSVDSGDLDIVVGEKDNVQKVKQMIRSSRPHLTNRRLRLIYSGRVLNPLIVVLPWLRLLSEKTKASVHQSNTTLRSAFEDLSASNSDRGGPGKGEEEDETYWIHCSVGLSFETSEEEEDKRNLAEPTEDSQTTPPLRGFDLLRTTAGLSEADIAIMRQQFHGVNSEAELDENAERLEDQWIAGGGGAGSLDDDVDRGQYRSSLQGALTGWFFPLLPLFFFREPNSHSFLSPGTNGDVPTVLFSRQMLRAIIIGLFVNALIGFIRVLN